MFALVMLDPANQTDIASTPILAMPYAHFK